MASRGPQKDGLPTPTSFEFVALLCRPVTLTVSFYSMESNPMPRSTVSSFLLAGIFLYSALQWSAATHGQAQPIEEVGPYLQLMEDHFRELAATGTDTYGPDATPMWMSVIDTRTGRPPEKPHTPTRVYRLIGAPRGSTLYWDQPLMVAAYELSRLTGKPEYEESSARYIGAFLDRCVDGRGMFEWGNHQYYDAIKDETVKFSGGFHELRPIPPAWGLFWQQDRQKCAQTIRTMVGRHVYDTETGGFNRHDDGKRGHAFIESGGVLVESLAWLYREIGESDLLTDALRIARYSHSHRGELTGLVKNEPDSNRWDSKVSTTEIGVWAQSLLRASEYTSNDEFTKMAQSGVAAYLKYGFDQKTQQYFGQVGVDDGKPVTPQAKGYWPGKYANIWNMQQWPTHDYPMAVAEACVTLYLKTEDTIFLQGIRRWARVISDQTPANEGKGAYAEHYGRCIHFLVRAGRVLEDEEMIAQARVLTKEAVDHLQEGKLFQGFPETHWKADR